MLRVVAIYSVQGWCWNWVRDVRALVFALDAEAAGQQPWQQLARQAALRGKPVARAAGSGLRGCKDMSETWIRVAMLHLMVRRLAARA